MATKEKLLEELNYLTEKISSLVWTLNVGVLGTTWSLLITTVPENVRFSVRNAFWVFVPSLLSIVGELAQYLAGYLSAHRICEKLEQKGEEEFQYPKDRLYYARRFFFWWKIVFTTLAVLILLYTLIWKLFA
jgi:hypothetical protein